VLREPLSGNSKVAIVVCGSLEQRHTSETLQTMRFGQSVGSIEYDVSANLVAANDAVAAINEELRDLEKVGVLALPLRITTTPDSFPTSRSRAEADCIAHFIPRSKLITIPVVLSSLLSFLPPAHQGGGTLGEQGYSASRH
jgi:hypothetical protein